MECKYRKWLTTELRMWLRHESWLAVFLGRHGCVFMLLHGPDVSTRGEKKLSYVMFEGPWRVILFLVWVEESWTQGQGENGNDWAHVWIQCALFSCMFTLPLGCFISHQLYLSHLNHNSFSHIKFLVYFSLNCFQLVNTGNIKHANICDMFAPLSFCIYGDRKAEHKHRSVCGHNSWHLFVACFGMESIT